MADRTCARCGASAADVPFKKNRQNADGLGSYCLACNREIGRASYLANRVAIQDVHRQYRESHADLIKARDRDRQEDPTRQAQGRQATARWKAQHPEQAADINFNWAAEQRVRAAGFGASIEMLRRRDIWNASHGVCGICGDPVSFDDMHVDHVFPISKGGAHVATNVQASHAACNRRKQATEVPRCLTGSQPPPEEQA